MATPIWRDMMMAAAKAFPSSGWKEPTGVTNVRVEAESGKLALGGGGLLIPAVAGSEPGAPGAQGGKHAGGRGCARLFGHQIDRATKGGKAQVAGVARATLDHRCANHRCQEKAGGVVRRVVGVAPGDAVKSDVVLVVAKAAQRGLGLAQARAVGRVTRQAGCDVDDAAVFGGGRHRRWAPPTAR